MRKSIFKTGAVMMAVAMMLLMVLSGKLEVSAAGVRDVFDAEYYASSYADLKAAYGNNKEALFQHYMSCGLNEGRVANPTFNLVAYRNGYADLQAAFGNDWNAYANHYLTIGKAEGRTIGTITAAQQQNVRPVPSAAQQQNIQPALATNNIYNAMIALKAQYPEGMPWTNDNYYKWQGWIHAYGCVAFACILSDAAFGNAPFTEHRDFNNIKVGDILRVNNDTHSVIVLEVQSDSVIVAEGNYNSSVHWGRKISRQSLVNGGNYIWTRY